MTELLSGGRDDRPARAWPKVAATAVVAALAVSVGLGQLHRGQPTATPTRSASPSVSLSPSQSSGMHVEPRLAGVPAAVPGGVRLVIGGRRPAVLGAGAPALRRVPMPAGWEVARVTTMAAGLLVAIQRLQQSDTAPTSRIYLLRPDGSAVLIAAANQAVAGFDGKVIFTLRAATTVPEPGNPPQVLSEVSLTGRILHRRTVPAWFDLQVDTAAGLLIAVYRPPDGPTDLRIVDRSTLAVRHRLGKTNYVLTASPTRAAWVTAGCTTAYRLVAANLATGARQTITLASGYSAGAAAFSPNGRRLAVSYYGRHPGSPGGAAPGVVDVVALTTGHRQRLPGVATGIKQAADLSWTIDGQWLAVAVGWPDSDFRRIGLWPATAGPIHLLPGRYQGGYLSGGPARGLDPLQQAAA